MFDWFKNMFSGASSQVGKIDPASGVRFSEMQPGGTVQGPDEGSGEGASGDAFTRQQEQYGQIGRAIQQQAAVPHPNLIQGAITAGFDQNWLAEQTSAGSANGAKL